MWFKLVSIIKKQDQLLKELDVSLFFIFANMVCALIRNKYSMFNLNKKERLT